MSKAIPTPAEFEPEFITGLKAIFEEKIVFNCAGLQINALRPEQVSVARIAMRT